MRSTIKINSRILNALVNSKNATYMTVEDIARAAYGEAYIRDTRKYLNALIKRNMASAMELAIKNDMIILPVKSKKDGLIRKELLGYKIADRNDHDIIQTLLQDKEQRANAYILSAKRFQDNLFERQLMPSQMQIRLHENNLFTEAPQVLS
jgi:hypothetical protein